MITFSSNTGNGPCRVPKGEEGAGQFTACDATISAFRPLSPETRARLADNARRYEARQAERKQRVYRDIAKLSPRDRVGRIAAARRLTALGEAEPDEAAQ